MNKSLLLYLFESVLGRTLLVLFIMIASSFNMLLGITSLVILVGFYNSKVFEGLENQSQSQSQNQTDKNKKSNDIVSSVPIAMQNQVNKISAYDDKKIDPVEKPIGDKTHKTQPLASSSVIKESKPIKTKEAFESIKQNRLNMLNIEGCIRPKCSNSLPISSLESFPASYEPESNFSGIEAFQSGYSII